MAIQLNERGPPSALSALCWISSITESGRDRVFFRLATFMYREHEGTARQLQGKFKDFFQKSIFRCRRVDI